MELPPDGYINQDGDYVTGVGSVLENIHPVTTCDGAPCVIHNPTDHIMRHLPTNWRDDVRVMERICSHGVGHPDPDHMSAVQRLQGDDAVKTQGIHGCDGCCREKVEEPPMPPLPKLPTFGAPEPKGPSVQQLQALLDVLTIFERRAGESGAANAYAHAACLVFQIIEDAR